MLLNEREISVKPNVLFIEGVHIFIIVIHVLSKVPVPFCGDESWAVWDGSQGGDSRCIFWGLLVPRAPERAHGEKGVREVKESRGTPRDAPDDCGAL